MPTKTEIYAHDDFPSDLVPLMETWEAECFPEDDNPFTWTDEDPAWHVLVWADDAPVSYLCIYERMVKVGEQAIPVGGIGNVMTPVKWRRRGFASTGLQHAGAFMRDEMGIAFGLLVTSENRFLFYGRAGWQQVKGKVVFAQPDGKQGAFQDEMMILPLTDEAWPSGTIDLCGLPW